MDMILAVAGVFAILLGVWHLGVPRWFDFPGAIGGESGAALRPMRLGPWSRATARREVLGLSWVMSNAASYVLVSVGIVDLVAATWLGSPAAPLIGGWIGGWWAVRAISQLAVGRRRLDVAVGLWFGGLALVHLVAALG